MSQESTPEPGPRPGKSSGWENARALAGNLATPLTVAIVGVLTSVYVNQQQTAETNRRAFTELLSQREEADTNLRREMFKTVLDSVLQKGSNDLLEQILKLEILAYNFHESLDLGPLFQDVLRRVDPSNPNDPNLQRLTKVAADVVFKQVEGLTFDIGVSKDAQVDFAELKADPSGIPNVIDEVLRLRYPEREAALHPARRFRLDVFGRDLKQQELRLHLRISPAGADASSDEAEVDVEFSVGYFDFPSINNTRLSNGERCAVVVRNMDQDSARIILVYFPANRAGLKDRMYVEEVLQQMVRVAPE